MTFPAHTPSMFLVEWEQTEPHHAEGVHQLLQTFPVLQPYLGPVVYASAEAAEARVDELRKLPEAVKLGLMFRVVEYRRHASWVPS